jgi:hypothetical protein
MSESKKMITCAECKYARLMQWMENPVISECKITGSREVATYPRNCELYSRTDKKHDIEHFEHY